ncbi:unnamed protein product, partial [marine sediment metagenome]
CKRLGFTQKHDLGLICGHIQDGLMRRIMWPDANAPGLYTTELLENWKPLPKPDKWMTGNVVSTEDDVKVKALRRFHLGAGVHKDKGEVFGVSRETAERLVRRHVAVPWDEDEGEAKEREKAKKPSRKITKALTPEENKAAEEQWAEVELEG